MRSQIDSGNPLRIKSALQTICEHYRKGALIRPDELHKIRLSVIGTAYQTNDEKVRRWVVNTLARIGSHAESLPVINFIYDAYSHEPEMVAACVAAAHKICAGSSLEKTLSKWQASDALATLAALQHKTPATLPLKGLPLNVETADAELLKLGLIVVGLGNSPGNILNPRHTDAEMVKSLGSHHDPIVSQYSIWAIAENTQLSVADLGIDIRDVNAHPENVRSWIYRLIAQRERSAKECWEVILEGTTDPSAEARRGLARGLQGTFIDIMEPWITDWLVREGDSETRLALLTHLAKQSNRSQAYANFALQIYESEPEGSVARETLETASINTDLYVQLKRLSAGGGADLFSLMEDRMAKGPIIIQNLQAGAVALGGGQATNYGAIHNQALSADQKAKLQSDLFSIQELVPSLQIDARQKEVLLDAVTAAKDDPNPKSIKRVIEVMSDVGKVAEVGSALAPYLATLATLLM